MPHILNDSSPRLNLIPNAKLELKPHQQAMVHKCLEMENDYFKYVRDRKGKRQQDTSMCSNDNLTPDQGKDVSDFNELKSFGVLGTTVGSGKTYAIISLILLDKERKKSWVDKLFASNVSMSTLIVVPSHLYYQWVESFERFAGGALSVRQFDDYDSITDLFYNKTDVTKGSDVFLVSSMYYSTVATTLTGMKLTFKRVVFDEIDSIDTMLRHIVGGAYTWFVSGSFKNMLNKSPSFQFGPHSIDSKDLLHNYIDCDDQFVLDSFTIPPYVYESITCDNKIMDVLKHVLSPDALYALNSCDPQTALMKSGQHAVACIQNDHEFARILLSNWEKSIEQLKEYLENLKKHLSIQKKADHIKMIKDDQHEKENELKQFQEKFDHLSGQLQNITIEHIGKPKIAKLTNILIKNKHSKMLIYSEYPRCFTEVSKILEENNIGYVDFEGGNNEEMNKAIHRFKNDEKICVFMAHSVLFSCGMNLENATHIIFMHRVKPEVQKQVIGRGQRPGRTCKLHVYELVYKNEKLVQF